jgi:hypothetical protein
MRPDVLNVTPEPDLEDLRPTKRRRPVERLTEHLKHNPVPTPKLTPLLTPSGGVSHSRASTERGLQSVDSSELHTADNSDNSTHNPRASEVLLPSRRAVSPSKGIAGEQNFGPDLERCEENREGSGGEFGEATTNSIKTMCCSLDLRQNPLNDVNAVIVHSRRNGTVHHELLLGDGVRARCRQEHRNK